MSPEVLKGDDQGYEVDTWAIGVLLYELFHNTTPFKGKTVRELLNNILEKKPKKAGMVPKEAKDLILKLLTVDPTKRITLEEVKTHPFVLKYACELTDDHSKPAEKHDHIETEADFKAKKEEEALKEKEIQKLMDKSKGKEVSDDPKKAGTKAEPGKNTKR